MDSTGDSEASGASDPRMTGTTRSTQEAAPSEKVSDASASDNNEDAIMTCAEISSSTTAVSNNNHGTTSSNESINGSTQSMVMEEQHGNQQVLEASSATRSADESSHPHHRVENAEVNSNNGDNAVSTGEGNPQRKIITMTAKAGMMVDMDGNNDEESPELQMPPLRPSTSTAMAAPPTTTRPTSSTSKEASGHGSISSNQNSDGTDAPVMCTTITTDTPAEVGIAGNELAKSEESIRRNLQLLSSSANIPATMIPAHPQIGAIPSNSTHPRPTTTTTTARITTNGESVLSSGQSYSTIETTPPTSLRYQEGIISRGISLQNPDTSNVDGATTTPAVVPIAAELSPTDDDIEKVIQERLERQYEDRMEHELRKRISKQQSQIAQAEVVPVGDDDDHTANQSSSDEMTKSRSSFLSSDNHGKKGERDNSKRERTKKRLIFAAIGCIFILITVIVAIVVANQGQNNDGGGERTKHNQGTVGTSGGKGEEEGADDRAPSLRTGAPAETSPTHAPIAVTSSPTKLPTTSVPTQAPIQPTPEQLFQLYMNALLPMLPPSTTRATFEDTSTPQFQALDWLSKTPSATLARLSAAYDYQHDADAASSKMSALNQQYLLESYVAVLVYLVTDGPNWIVQSNFLSPTLHICDWHDKVGNSYYGILCNDDHTIGNLHFAYNNMVGTLPDEVFLLPSLEFIVGRGNWELEGSLPTYIGTMTHLAFLDVAKTSFGGIIPTEIGNMPILDFLSLYSTDIRGTIPTELGNTKTLEWMSLDGSFITGTIPSELGQLTRMSSLYLFDMDISGTIPSEFMNLNGLDEISIEGTFLTGNLDPIFCRDDLLYEYFWSSCKSPGVLGDYYMEPAVSCSCCSHCCENDGLLCVVRSDESSLPCYDGECVSCGNGRFVNECGECVDLEVQSLIDVKLRDSNGNRLNLLGSTPEELCVGSCMWNGVSEICEDRMEFHSFEL